MQDDSNTRQGEQGRDDDVRRLIRFAGAREQVTMDRFEKAHGRVSDHWQRVVDERKDAQRQEARRHRTTRIKAFAAVTVLAIAAYWGVSLLESRNTAPFATVVAAVGDVYVDDLQLTPGQELRLSSVVTTQANERLVLELDSGYVVKLDQNSTLIADGRQRLRLNEGAVFVRSVADTNAESLQIVTPFGTATDVGTQFIVQLNKASIRIAVREGLVHLINDLAARLEIVDGELLSVSRSGQPDKQPIAADDPLWSWADSMPGAFDIEGATLASYLEWYAGQIGAVLKWADDASEKRARAIVLSGSIAGTTLNEGLEEVRRIAPFDTEVTDDAVLVTVD